MKQEKSCGALVFRSVQGETEVLLINQVQGHWCFPKGHMEKNETEQETACREIHEETGLKVCPLAGFRHSLNYSPVPGVMKEAVYFIAVNPKGRIRVQKDELNEACWVSITEARQLITYDNDAAMFEKALAWLNSHKEILV